MQSINLFQQGKEFAIPSQGINRDSIILPQQVVVGADPVDAVRRGFEDDRKDEFALDEIGS